MAAESVAIGVSLIGGGSVVGLVTVLGFSSAFFLSRLGG